MAESEKEIVVEDPNAPAEDSPGVANTRTVDIVVSLLLIAFAGLMAFDNWRTGMGWAPDGPKAGYFPFYLSMVLGGASLYGLVVAFLERASAQRIFVNRDQLRRVMQVFVPTCLFCLVTQWLGLYVASFLLVAGFMRVIGRIAWWKSLLTSFIFALAMFVTFDVAFTMDPTSAIVMLSCIYWGALFGGAITSILFNIPGEAWSVATTFDGYPMAQQGKAAEALTAAFTSSFIGSLVAVLLITFLAP